MVRNQKNTKQKAMNKFEDEVVYKPYQELRAPQEFQ